MTEEHQPIINERTHYPEEYWYHKNPNLKKSGINLDYSLEQLEEIKKCQKNYKYFINNYVYIITLDHGLQKFKQYKFQKKMTDIVHKNRFSIFKIPRQSGKTTTIAAYLVWYAIFHSYKTIGIVANKGDTAKKILEQIRITYINLPFWLQQGVTYLSKMRIGFENGSKIICQATSGDAFSGYSLNILYWDEVAKVPKGKADDFLHSVYPTISSSKESKIVMTSTPVGFNQFAKFWFDAKDGKNNFKHFECAWTDVPGRTKAWKEDRIQELGMEGWEQEFECEFLGSSKTLIGKSKLKQLFFKEPIETFFDGSLKIYEEFQKDRIYAFIVDTSEGKKQDSHAISIIDITEAPFRQVAVYRNNKISYLVLPTIIDSIIKKYRLDTIMAIENNNLGAYVLNDIHSNLETETYLFNERDDELGVRSTVKSKKIGNLTLKNLIEDEKLLVFDFDTVSELYNYEQSGSSYKAAESHTDDLVTTLRIFSYLTTTPEFSEYALAGASLSEKTYGKQLKDAQDEVMPAGFNDDGIKQTILDDGDGADSWLR